MTIGKSIQTIWTLVTVVPGHIVFANAFSSRFVTRHVFRSLRIARTWFAIWIAMVVVITLITMRKVDVPFLALIAFVSTDIGFASTDSIVITIQTIRSFVITSTF